MFCCLIVFVIATLLFTWGLFSFLVSVVYITLLILLVLRTCWLVCLLVGFSVIDCLVGAYDFVCCFDFVYLVLMICLLVAG